MNTTPTPTRAPTPTPTPPAPGRARRRPRSFFDEIVVALAQPGPGLLLFILGAGLVSLALGQDASWDLKNHHYYNPWAFLNKRAAIDSAPAGLQSFLNPLPDLPFYALVAGGLPAWIVTFLMGLPAGVGAYFLFRIARRVVVDLRVHRRALALTAICLVAFTGTASLSQVGSTTNEWQTAALVLPALFLLVREGHRAAGPSRTMFALIGILLGLAVGLKPAAAPYAVAAAVVTLVCFRDRPRRHLALVLLVVYGLLGFLVGYGYWGAWLAGRYDNPFFPYFNGIFRSEFWDPVNLVDARFRPQTLRDWLAWPLRLAERNQAMTEPTMREPRLAVLYLVAVSLALATVVEAIRGTRSVGAVIDERMPRSVQMVALFTFTAYGVWVVTSASYRDTVVAELLASLLLVVGMGMALRGAKHRDLLIGVTCIAVVAQTLAPNWGRTRAGGGPWFDVQVPLVASGALVVTTAEPIGYLVPFMAPGVRVMRLLGAYRDRPSAPKLQQRMHDQVAAHDGPLFVLRRTGVTDANEEAMLAGYGLVRLDRACEPVRSNVEEKALEICPLERK